MRFKRWGAGLALALGALAIGMIYFHVSHPVRDGTGRAMEDGEPGGSSLPAPNTKESEPIFHFLPFPHEPARESKESTRMATRPAGAKP